MGKIRTAILDAKKQFAPDMLAERCQQNVVDKYWDTIKAAAGFLPPSLVAVRIDVETRGNAKVGPHPTTGEVGLLQLWPETWAKCGMKTSMEAYDPEKNIKCGCAHWRDVVRAFRAQFPTLFPVTNASFWTTAQLATMIGRGALNRLLTASKAAPGREFEDISAWIWEVDEGLEKSSSWFGTQSAELVARRVTAAGCMTQAANLIEPISATGAVASMGTTGTGIALLAISFLTWQLLS
jgi:hypothetical protein